MRPQPKHEPISEGFIGQPMGHLRATTQLYLPFLFSEIKCDVGKFEMDMKNMRQMTIKTNFHLKGSEKILKNLYEDENWKVRSIENFLRATKPEIQINQKIAPILVLMLNKFLRVERVRLKLDRTSSYVLFDQTPDIVFLPTSYPPLTDLPDSEFYAYYEKKNTVIYAPLEFDKNYELEIDLETIAGSFELAPLFPYGNVDFSKITTNCICSGGYKINALCMRVNPVTDRQLPDWLKYKLEREIGTTMQSYIVPANPFRGSFPLFNIAELGVTKEDFMKEKGEVTMPLSKLKEVACEEYETFRVIFSVLIPPDKDYDIITKVIQIDLPTRIYEQLQNIPGYNDVLVEYDVINLTHSKKKIKATTELVGLTDVATEEITIEGLNNEQGKPARTLIRQCPLMKYGILETIVNPQRATLNCKLVDSDAEKTIYEKSYNIGLLPHDQMVWEMRDVGQSRTHNLVDFICSWVHPTDIEGLLDSARANSIKYHPDNAFGHKISNLPDIETHVKALWEYLSKEVQIKYLNQSFSAKNTANSQRVLLPEKTLKNKAGNCIDLTILFASILEGVGIFSIIFLTEDHAFIGWGNSRRTSEMFFLETTLIDSSTFEDAKIIGEEKFKKNFLFIGAKNPLPDLMSVTQGRHIIDLRRVRSEGIVSKR
jgi:hypothetical protein